MKGIRIGQKIEKFNWKKLKPRKGDITDTQKWILHYWVWYFQKNQVPPTMETAKKDLGYSGTSGIQRMLTPLVKKGYLKRFERKYIPSNKSIVWLGQSEITNSQEK